MNLKNIKMAIVTKPTIIGYTCEVCGAMHSNDMDALSCEKGLLKHRFFRLNKKGKHVEVSNGSKYSFDVEAYYEKYGWEFKVSFKINNIVIGSVKDGINEANVVYDKNMKSFDVCEYFNEPNIKKALHSHIQLIFNRLINSPLQFFPTNKWTTLSLDMKDWIKNYTHVDKIFRYCDK